MSAGSIRLFVGASPGGMDLETERVLEHSARKHSSLPVDITWMRADASEGPWAGWDRRRWATPFSGYRWAVPEAAGHEGRAIYMDNDVLVLGDLAELWHADLGGKPIMARWPGRLCVSVFDCASAREVLPSIEAMRGDSGAHARLQDTIGREHIAKLDPRWNCLDGEDMPLEAIKGLHFTDMSTQPAAVLADARLRSAVQRNVSHRPRKHWYQGKRRDHQRRDCVDLFLRYHEEAARAGAPKAVQAVAAAGRSTGTPAAEAAILSALQRAEEEAEPFRHWLLEDVLDPDTLAGLKAWPAQARELHYDHGCRQEHNAGRQFVDACAIGDMPSSRALAEAFQGPRVTEALERFCGIDLAGTYLRIEYAHDTEGYWSKPHTDIADKVFTMFIYMDEGGDGPDWGTDLFHDPETPAKRLPYADNVGAIFVPASDTWHGFRPRPIEGVRRTLLINYVAPGWRGYNDPRELAYPETPVGYLA